MDAVKKKSVPRTQPLARRKMTTAVYFKQNWSLYLFLIPAVLLVFFFNYIPLYGIQIAFRDYTPAEGFFRK